MQEIPYNVLVDLAEGRLTSDEAALWRARIAGDPRAGAELAGIERLVRLMRTDDSVDAPAHVVARALRLVRRPEAPPLSGALRRLIASIVSDSWGAPLAAGIRSVQAWPRALLLSAGDHEIDIQVAPFGDQWRVQGQLLGPEAPATVALSGPGGQVSIDLNEVGEFVTPPLAAGRYTLTLRQGDLEIVVSNLEVGPSSPKS